MTKVEKIQKKYDDLLRTFEADMLRTVGRYSKEKTDLAIEFQEALDEQKKEEKPVEKKKVK